MLAQISTTEENSKLIVLLEKKSRYISLFRIFDIWIFWTSFLLYIYRSEVMTVVYVLVYDGTEALLFNRDMRNVTHSLSAASVGFVFLRVHSSALLDVWCQKCLITLNKPRRITTDTVLFTAE